MNNTRHILLVALGGIIIGFFAAYLLFGVVLVPSATDVSGLELGLPEAPVRPLPAGDCTVTDAPATVSGNSMSGIVSSGAQVTVFQNYYACHDVLRGDIVAYDYPGMPIIKKVFGIPGDALALARATSSNGATGWSILINGKPLVNSVGLPYLISDVRQQMLASYVNEYDGVIPSDAYLILGNDPAGSNDSTVFGLVAKEDFLGKVEL